MHSFVSILQQIASVVLIVTPSVRGHCKIVHAAASLSQPGPRSHGFGIDLSNKFPWFMSQGGDAGADSPFFSKKIEYVANPNPPCGESEALGPIDLEAAWAQADGLGTATTAADGSFDALIFQVNRDGAGACTCEYDPSGKAHSWKHCKTLANPPGIGGMWPQDRVNHTAKFQIPSNAVCHGGLFEDKCLVRIRCGFKLRFGGCLAMKTPESPEPLHMKVVGGTGSSSATNSNFGPSDISAIAQQVFDTLKAKGVLVPSNQHGRRSHKENKPTLNHKASRMSSRSPESFDAKANKISAKVIELMRAHKVLLAKSKAIMVLKEYQQSISQS